MTHENPQEQASLETLYWECSALQSSVERAGWLQQRCHGNPALRAKLEQMLAMEDDADRFAEDLFPMVQLDEDREPFHGGMIGPYKLLQELGRGGMGVVYMAEQREPVRRRVALKLIKPGMDTSQVIARFEAERQALAMMDHSNIAKVLEAGATDSGRPYFVMELVNGLPITQYCDEQHLTPKERLELFLPVCQAVQHAHQKGIIHRDLKPSNILVAQYDGRPVPKIIDFGVAKATSQLLTERTMFTQWGQIVGTLEYMSPEQAQFNQLDIDTRTDVYSLGVVLYELLTGDTPFDRARLKSAAIEEMLRIIREDEPPRPSTKLSGSQTLPSVAANRKLEPAKLAALLRGEIDWIVMKALEKDRARRYETASSFADDLQRYLSHEPVLACPPSAAYRFSKFARRNRVLLGTLSAVVVALLLGLTGTSLQTVRAMRAEKRAIAERDGKEEARREAVTSAQREAEQRKLAEQAEQKAKEERAIANAVSEFLRKDLLGVGGTVAQLEAQIPPDPELKVATLLERALGKVEQRFADQPHVRAEIQATLADSLNGIGRYQQSERLWEKVLDYRVTSLGPDHLETLNAMLRLGLVYRTNGKLNQSLSLLKDCLQRRNEQLGAEHPDTIGASSGLALTYSALGQFDLALPALEEITKTLKATPETDPVDIVLAFVNLGGVHLLAKDLESATAATKEAVDLAKKHLDSRHPLTLSGMTNLAKIYQDTGKLAEALSAFEECLTLSTTNHGAAHPRTLHVMNNLAMAYIEASQLEKALPLLQKCVSGAHQTYGKDSPANLIFLKNLASLYTRMSNWEMAIPLRTEILEVTRSQMGAGHQKTLSALVDLANTHRLLEQWDVAIPLLHEAAKCFQETLGDENPNTAATVYSYALALNGSGKTSEAVQLLAPVVPILRKTYPNESQELTQIMLAVAEVLLRGGEFEQAETILYERLMIRERNEPNAWTTYNTQSNLGAALLGQKKYADAEPLLLAGYEGMKAREMHIPIDSRIRLNQAIERLIALYTATAKLDEAQRWQAELEQLQPTAKEQGASTHEKDALFESGLAKEK